MNIYAAVYECMCVCVCLSVCTLKAKQILSEQICCENVVVVVMYIVLNLVAYMKYICNG